MSQFAIKDMVVSLGVEPCVATQQPRSNIFLCRGSQMRCSDDIPKEELAELIEQLEQLLAQIAPSPQ
jgi:hypothetical protein